MNTLLTSLITLLLYQSNLINVLYIYALGKPFFNPKPEEPTNKKYHPLTVDQRPIFEKLQKYDYKTLIKIHEAQKGKLFKPIKPRKGKQLTPSNVQCPVCGAPHQYIYSNNGGKGQFLCKVCAKPFSRKNRFSKDVQLRCPHCHSALSKIKTRKGFHIFKCLSKKCPFYRNNLERLNKKDRKMFKKHPERFKMHYLYREFTFDFQPLSSKNKALPKVSLANIRASSYTLGLILTYRINYGIPARKVAALMYDIHGVKISYQTVLNYCNAAGFVLKPFIDTFDYDLSGDFCGDETYIRVKGKWQYIFYFFDATKKIILSYYVSPNRDTPSAIIAINQLLSKLKVIPENLSFVVDGNPIYQLAKLFFAQHDIFFDIIQVIGLTNEDELSKEFRPMKQIIERLNRTFKTSYRSSHGFHAQDGSVAFVNLFVAHFNFLRRHRSLGFKVPAYIHEVQIMPNMPAKWGKLIQLAENQIIELNNSA